MRTNIGILLYEGMEELDFVGPLEVFGMACHGRDDARVFTVAETRAPVRAFNGLTVLPDHCFDDAPELDVVLVPGGLGSRKQVENPKLVRWLRDASQGCRWVTSVCTGTLLLHEAGPARGKRVTTHWGFLEPLRQRGEIEVLDGPRYVRDGNLVTSAGVSAGIDMALWLVGQLFGVERARAVQRMMQYDPAPPYAADV
jgi:transcriptional regulator GlxA family with amidase domain